MKKVTLCMLAKNEGQVINRALHSAMPLFNHVAVLLDDKTTDDTEAVVEKFGWDHEIPVTIVKAPWVHFGENRNQLLELGRKTGAEWLVLLDADDHFSFDLELRDFELEDDVDAYEVKCSLRGYEFWRVQIIRADKDWFFDLPTHEGLYCRDAFRAEKSDLVMVMEHDPKPKAFYLQDAKLLLTYLETHKDHPRALFYLAQSFRNAGLYREASTIYMRRAALGCWYEEVYVSLLEAAKCLEYLRLPAHEIAAAYMRAHFYRPVRAEAIWHLCRFLRSIGNPTEALIPLLAAAPPPEDILLIERMCYNQEAPVFFQQKEKYEEGTTI